MNQYDESEVTLDEIFEGYLKSPKLFKRRDVLDSSFVPENLPHRTDQIKQLGYILASVLRGAKPSNILCFGKTGTGKTAVSKYVLNILGKKAPQHGLRIEVAYLNCNTVDTNYRVFADLCSTLGIEVPFTGLATDEVFSRFKLGLDQRDSLFIVVLDEIDSLIKKSGNETLYNLTRINSDLSRAKVSLIGISNDLKFKEYLDPRVLSSLSEEELVFKPYEAPELTDILIARAELAFKDQSLAEGVINMIAAIAAQEHGDARRAIDLLRVSSEIAEREGVEKINQTHVKKAQGAIERNTITEVISTLPLQSKMVIVSIYSLERLTNHSETVSTGDVYEEYSRICKEMGMDSLTQRRVGDLINELDALGIISARVVSRGRHGRTKEIRFSIPKSLVETTLHEDKMISVNMKF
ncbi:MAG: ORC1-type DNA replication protein [Candidatus Heimdallarchaeota archaeon]|nr:MAG: ORC1-type DNA replication protein [Candidatus Heimdallarchaeota archaeon]